MRLRKGITWSAIFPVVLFIRFVLCASWAEAQVPGCGNLQVQVVARQGGLSLPGATVRLFSEGYGYGDAADERGEVFFRDLAPGRYRLEVRHLGYLPLTDSLTIGSVLQHRVVKLQTDRIGLDDIVVTAREAKGISTATKIDRAAMAHLQPSGFADLLELLPGGVSSVSRLGSLNTIRLREAGEITQKKYATTSLGTGFVIDGMPLNTAANMQSVTGRVWSRDASLSRQRATENLGQGVDMRAISTDDIESVEIIRGIPSVSYGNVTSGVVNIKRRSGRSNRIGRMKADQRSKLFYLGKGFSRKGGNRLLNIGLDYLASYIDPRDRYSTFNRLTGSVRCEQKYRMGKYRLSLGEILDYGGTFDNIKSDPERHNVADDRFFSENNRLSVSSRLTLQADSNRLLLQRLDATAGISLERNKITEHRHVYTVRINPLTINPGDGESDAVFSPSDYPASVIVEGMPVTAYGKLQASLRRLRGHRLIVGVDWSYAKNYGRGAIYDVTRPITIGMTTRPRPKSDIPAENRVAIYLENNWHRQFGICKLESRVGVRANLLLLPSDRYRMSGRVFPEPRASLSYTIEPEIAGRKLTAALTGGAGRLLMFPGPAYIYPDKLYYDIVELNYYAANPDHRRVHFRTYVVDGNNYALMPADNLKQELRLDLDYAGFNLSITAFREDLKSGFRPGERIETFRFRRYDTSGLDPATLTGPPDLNLLPSRADTVLALIGTTDNGSRTLKQGIEWQASTPRFPYIHTRITCNGAWFRTTYNNSRPVYDRPPVIVNGRELPVVGIYRNDDRYVFEQLTFSLLFDTYIRRFNLSFSTAFQAEAYARRSIWPQSRRPFAYMDMQGVERAYPANADQDPVLRQLVVEGSRDILRSDVPFAGYINFKATKQFLDNRLGVALFVNKMIAVEPPYQRGEYTIYRSTSPYFGMELNLSL